MNNKCTWHDHLTPHKNEKKIDDCLCLWPGLAWRLCLCLVLCQVCYDNVPKYVTVSFRSMFVTDIKGSINCRNPHFENTRLDMERGGKKHVSCLSFNRFARVGQYPHYVQWKGAEIKMEKERLCKLKPK